MKDQKIQPTSVISLFLFLFLFVFHFSSILASNTTICISFLCTINTKMKETITSRLRNCKMADSVITTAQTITPTAGLILIGSVSQGAGRYNRIGNGITYAGIKINLTLRNVQTVSFSAAPDQVRIALVYDRQPNGTTPSYQDIYQEQLNTGATGSTVWCGQNPDNIDRFTVVKEWNIATPGFSNNGSGDLVAMGAQDSDFFHSTLIYEDDDLAAHNLQAFYSSSASGIANFTQGALWLVRICAFNSSAGWLITGRIRTFWYDNM